MRLHLRTSSHLSTVRTVYRDTALAGHLSSLLAASSAVVHGSRARTWRQMAVGVTRTFPAALWHLRVPIAVATAVFLVAAVTVGAWMAFSPAAAEVAMPPEAREAFAADFEQYYSAEAAPTFGSRVFTNNVSVAVLAFGLGVAFAVPTLLVLLLNAANVGVAGGILHAAGFGSDFWRLILPHGLLELTAVFVAGGAGLALGWALLAPGDRTRRDALRDEARRAVVIVLGLVPVFAVAALIEAFVTPAPWPVSLRVGIGALAWAAFCLYAGLLGRRAHRQGWTGQLGEEPGGTPTPAAPSPPTPAAPSPPQAPQTQSRPAALTSR